MLHFKINQLNNYFTTLLKFQQYFNNQVNIVIS